MHVKLDADTHTKAKARRHPRVQRLITSLLLVAVGMILGAGLMALVVNPTPAVAQPPSELAGVGGYSVPPLKVYINFDEMVYTTVVQPESDLMPLQALN